jgi:hypothetical protein
MKLLARRTKVAVVPLLAALLLHGRTALAGEPGDDDIERGVSLMSHADFAGALDAFREAYQKQPSARANAQMALAEQGLKRWADAELHLSSALFEEKDAWITDYRPMLEQALAQIRKHLGSLDVQGSPAGAVVEANGRIIGVLPFARPRRLAVGAIELTVRAPDHQPWKGVVRIESGATAKVTAALAPLTAPRLAVQAVRQPAPDVAAGAAPSISANAAPSRQSGGVGRNLVRASLVVFVLGDAAIVTGLVMYAAGKSPSTSKGLGIGGAVANVVAIGGLSAGLIVGSPSSPPSATSQARGVAVTWHF